MVGRMSRPASVAIVVLALSLGGCMPSSGSEFECDATPIREGPLPEWALTSGLTEGPHVVATDGAILGVLFVQPLRAGERTDGAFNKVLWIVRARNGSPLQLTGERLDAGGDTVSYSYAADSGPGEIYPSHVDVPASGCWRMALEWDGNASSVTLRYSD